MQNVSRQHSSTPIYATPRLEPRILSLELVTMPSMDQPTGVGTSVIFASAMPMRTFDLPDTDATDIL